MFLYFSSDQVTTDYVSGGNNSVLLVCDDKVMVGGCVQGTCSVLTHVSGCALTGGMLLSMGSPYIISTLDSADVAAASDAQAKILGMYDYNIVMKWCSSMYKILAHLL